MPLDGADATGGQLLLLAKLYAVSGVACGALAMTGTRSWRGARARITGGVCAALAVGYAGYLTIVLLRGVGFIPIAWIGLVIPVGMIANSMRHAYAPNCGPGGEIPAGYSALMAGAERVGMIRTEYTCAVGK